MTQLQPHLATTPQQAATAAREAQPTVADLVPDRPQRAPQVQLCGQLTASGYAATQWLVQRDDKFLQLTDVLYHILEQTR